MAHGRDAKVLEQDAKEQREGVVDEQAGPDAVLGDSGRGAVDEPFADEIAEDAASAAVGDAGGDGGPHWS